MSSRRDLLIAIVGAAVVALAAQARVPMEPVPTTLQTLAMFAIAAAFGPRVGAWTATVYLIAAWLGAPVLSGGDTFGVAGLLTSKTGGYVVAFVPAAWALGHVHRARWPTMLVAAVAAHALVLAIGGAWLAVHIGVGAAFEHGVQPFWIAALAKSALVPPLAVAARAVIAVSHRSD